MSWFSRAVKTVTKPLRALDNAVGGAKGWGTAVGFISPVGAVAAVGVGKATGNDALAQGAIAGAATNAMIGITVGSAMIGQPQLGKVGTSLVGAAANAAGKWATSNEAPPSSGYPLLDPSSRGGIPGGIWNPATAAPATGSALGAAALPAAPGSTAGIPPLLLVGGLAAVALLLFARS